MTTEFNTIEEALTAIRNGEMVVVVDDDDRENEGDLIMAASKATPEAVAFMIRHTSGICVRPFSGAGHGIGTLTQWSVVTMHL